MFRSNEQKSRPVNDTYNLEIVEHWKDSKGFEREEEMAKLGN
jgi:hypothetical protein